MFGDTVFLPCSTQAAPQHLAIHVKICMFSTRATPGQSIYMLMIAADILLNFILGETDFRKKSRIAEH